MRSVIFGVLSNYVYSALKIVIMYVITYVIMAYFTVVTVTIIIITLLLCHNYNRICDYVTLTFLHSTIRSCSENILMLNIIVIS